MYIWVDDRRFSPGGTDETSSKEKESLDENVETKLVSVEEENQIDELRKLVAQKERGILNEQEFELKKAQIFRF